MKSANQPPSNGATAPNPSAVDVREAFRPLAATYRKRTYVVMAALLTFPIVVWAVYSFASARIAGVMLALLIVVVPVLNEFYIPKLVCPACRRKANSNLDRFCPECGNAAIESIRSGVSLKCGSCARELVYSQGKRRPGWMIRFCTHCGAHLTKDGV